MSSDDASLEGKATPDEKSGLPDAPADPMKRESAAKKKTSLSWWRYVKDSSLSPEANANILNLLFFSWVTPILSLGYARPLQVPDLYKLSEDRSASVIADKILQSFKTRRKQADEYNERLAAGSIGPGVKGLWWTIKGKRQEREKQWQEKDGKKKASLILAMNDSIKWWFWSGGIMKVIGDTAVVTSPLLVKAITNFVSESYAARYTDVSPPPIGKGIGLAFGLLALQLVGSWCNNHFFYRSMSSAILLRGGLISAIYARSLRLSTRARMIHGNAKLITHVSADVSRIEICLNWFHMAWAAPIQLLICLILLLINLGPSALVGYGLLLLATPAQAKIMKQFIKLRKKSMMWTDKRSKALQEIFNGIQVIKLFAWELPFLKRISEYRQKEMKYIRTLTIYRAALNAFAISVPALAAVLSFITYVGTGHTLSAADVFSSLALFQLVRMPLMFLPMSLGSVTDAIAACGRLYAVFEAETVDATLVENRELDPAVCVRGAEFTWDSPLPQAQAAATKAPSPPQPTTVSGTDAAKVQQNVFKLADINLEVPRGQLVAITGAIGTGKTSLLQGLIGEMRRTAGVVEFGGSVSYCAQTAWIQNATIRENICFGRPFEEEKYWNAVRAACLQPDLDMLPNHDLTQVGEKGISLSGGQKQRVNICRAIYHDSDIVIFDDPLSALDAHVGKAVFNNVIKQHLHGKTRILVTHALHLLPSVDYIYTLADGRIAECGTYDELMENDGAFAQYVNKFGTNEETKKIEQRENANAQNESEAAPKKPAAGPGKAMMQEEERTRGSVKRAVWIEYLLGGHGVVLVPLLLLSLVVMTAAGLMSSYWLVYWEERRFDRPNGFYMGIYAALGISTSLSMFLMGVMFAMLTYYASQRLHSKALDRVIHAPMNFFDTTPLGRIIGRFGKDIDTVDNTIGDSMRMLMATLSAIAGPIILISIITPWFLIVIACVLVCYVLAASFYRASARELKVHGILRSSIYAHFAESLSGLTTIRAYGEMERFKREGDARVDLENRAYWLTVVNQRWLGIRLDFLGIVLTLAVSLLTIGLRFKISPGQTGVALAYIVLVQQSFGYVVRQAADVENNMNSVERILHYANEIEQEAPSVEDTSMPAEWPNKGEVEFKNITMKYRPELPLVLKGISMSIAAGEKIGFVGRTGAGKSSVMTALYRLVELSSGQISIDGVETTRVGLTKLRTGMSIIPQDAFLFSGTLRSNLDPFGQHDDASLWDALKRAHLVDPSSAKAPGAPNEAKEGTQPTSNLDLDSSIQVEGSNLSAGQRSLVSLARALVNDTKILILDEATASVDYETDRKIQDTIASEFRGRTILCIAHRLRTIISYDRICVLDSGRIAEFDTPDALYAKTDGIFRGMCDESSISLDDIQNAQNKIGTSTH
ncbi:P-loop containing nucleoside triphosphate hydrolase protein [Coniophora puteana RWD-64-598 SS2]|uniref:P-loop containing nucleoside triphosphate hydrolase protein n=1 Tax=Coniophora puteana (strain RWD-64-598) TaxID=741705 RepID=A0A5M3N011_CONPW|nr:P-loop containing nucleoside triphosphate hydrolase protein [Coniophora puteana RWD-64-598 SS2]EIW84231.1 P-loop containing nucleoside triphosphate hydrolase protein [Coniophora puteana RWD-64-598 SS2]